MISDCMRREKFTFTKTREIINRGEKQAMQSNNHSLTLAMRNPHNITSVSDDNALETVCSKSAQGEDKTRKK